MCPYCPGVAFQTKGHLKTHIETVHEKRRDHACPYCQGVAFGEQAEDAHRDGARKAQGPRLRLLQRRDVRDGRHPAHISVIHLKIKRSRGAK